MRFSNAHDYHCVLAQSEKKKPVSGRRTPADGGDGEDELRDNNFHDGEQIGSGASTVRSKREQRKSNNGDALHDPELDDHDTYSLLLALDLVVVR